MPVPYYLLSPRKLTLEEFANVLRKCGGTLDQSASSGRLSDGEQHVWVSLTNEELESYEPDERRHVLALLRAQPQTCILLDVSRTDGSELLAIDFACAFAEDTPIVLDDLNGHLLTEQDLYELRNRGLGLPKPA